MDVLLQAKYTFTFINNVKQTILFKKGYFLKITLYREVSRIICVQNFVPQEISITIHYPCVMPTIRKRRKFRERLKEIREIREKSNEQVTNRMNAEKNSEDRIYENKNHLEHVFV